MSKCSGNVRTICGLAAAVIVACPARAEDASCHYYKPDLSKNPVLALGHVTSAASRVHVVKGSTSQVGCPSRAPGCAEPGYLVPGDRVIISKRHDAFICATYTSAKGNDLSDWRPADAVAEDKAEPVALADWLGHWHLSNDAHDGNAYDEGDITVKAGKAGALRIEGAANDRINGRVNVMPPSAIKSDETLAGDRLSFIIDINGATLPVDKGDDSDCKVWMQRLRPVADRQREPAMRRPQRRRLPRRHV
jgi:hypothetical protein